MTQHPAAWHPDPLGRHTLRWWDGDQWTAHVSDGTNQTVDPEGITPTHMPQSSRSDDAVAQQVQEQVDRVQRASHDRAGATRAGSGHGPDPLLDADILVVNQKAKIIEMANEYMVYDEHGTQVGSVRQVGQNAARKALRLLTGLDQYLTHHLEITDATGRTCLRLTRPAKVFKSTVVVNDAMDNEIGRLVQQNMIGRIRFDLQAEGATIGSLQAENWRAWDFALLDDQDREVARIKKTWGGLLRAAFTTADNYALQVHEPLTDPLRSLVIAAALSVDLALKQDDSN